MTIYSYLNAYWKGLPGVIAHQVADLGHSFRLMLISNVK